MNRILETIFYQSLGCLKIHLLIKYYIHIHKKGLHFHFFCACIDNADHIIKYSLFHFITSLEKLTDEILSSCKFKIFI